MTGENGSRHTEELHGIDVAIRSAIALGAGYSALEGFYGAIGNIYNEDYIGATTNTIGGLILGRIAVIAGAPLVEAYRNWRGDDTLPTEDLE